MRELKLCPFCGSKDVGGAGGIVSCYDCGANTTSFDTTAEAVTVWNKRVDFSTVEGKQLISEKAIAYLFDNHPEAYKEFYNLI